MEQIYLELAIAEGCGPALVTALLDPHTDPERLRHDPPPELPPAARRRLLDPGLAARAHRLRTRAIELGFAVLTPGHADYPERLRDAPCRPLVLFARGDVSLLDASRRAVAVVGSRTPTPYGEAAARDFTGALATAGLPVWSGLAFGIDALAHEACLAADTPTVAVLPGGPDTAYPRRHEPLLERIVHSGGLALTEAPPGLRPTRGHFPRRNRVLAHCVEAVLVIEAGLASGSLHTARFAGEHGVTVFAVPGPYTSARSRGCHRLIDDGAQIAADPGELLRQLGATCALRGADPTPLLASATERTILDLLAAGPRPADLVRREAYLDEADFLDALLALVERRLVVRLAGDMLARTTGGPPVRGGTGTGAPA